MSVGIDYGLGKSNVDVKTGIRYGVISQNLILQAWADSSEPVYPDLVCPECEDTLTDDVCAEHGEIDEEVLRGMSEEMEPVGFEYSGEGYLLSSCLDNDVMVLKSPFYTHAEFCSPCVPGAGNLESPNPKGVKTYCLGPDWFEDGKAPYPVFKVEESEDVP